MPVSVTMPALGESVTEGTITRWLKQEGEQVEVDDPLLEVSTDKVDTEIPAPAWEVITAITAKLDETVAVGAQLAVIDETGGPGDAMTGSTRTAAADGTAFTSTAVGGTAEGSVDANGRVGPVDAAPAAPT